MGEYTVQQKPNRIIVHHTADSSARSQHENVNEYHRQRGFPQSVLGFWGGYHYLIEKDGTVFQYRLETEVGAHDADENLNSLGVCLAGNFSEEYPTKAQEATLALVLDQLIKRWNIPLDRIEPHRWNDTTSCPGTLLNDYWPRVIWLTYRATWLDKIRLWLSKNTPQ